MTDSTKSAKSRNISNEKPEKPNPDYPLFPHATKRWAKKVKGKLVYFGPWDDPEGALQRWYEYKAVYVDGLAPRPVEGAGATVADICNRFVTAKTRKFEAGEIVKRTLDEAIATTDLIVEQFKSHRPVRTLTPADFEDFRSKLAKTCGPVRLGNQITRIRSVFKMALTDQLIEMPVSYGSAFNKPSAAVERKQRAKQAKKEFSAAQIRKLLDAAPDYLKAMILLGVNCGLGNSDLGQLEMGHLSLATGWLDYPRPKTGVDRRAKLWPETVKAIEDALKTRTKPKDPELENRIFITKYGGSWHKETFDSPLSNEFKKLTEEVGIYQKGVGFYALRHVFETVAGGSLDQVAVDHIMGHAPRKDDMSARYREGISDKRLFAVAKHVRKWLYSKPRKAK